MTIGVTYDSGLSRVRVACSAAPAAADYATIERSADGGITWTTVRGGDAVALVSGACQLDDYEFVGNVSNTYRATYVDTADPYVVNVGTLGSANNGPVSPGLPASLADNDILLMPAVIRNTAGAPNTPAGWSVLADLGNFKVFIRVWATGVTAPTVTFAGGVANADTAARILAVRNADFSVAHALSSNASAQNAAFAAMAAVELKPDLMVVAGWKQATSTSSALTGWTQIAHDVLTAGDDLSLFWWRKTTPDDTPAGSVTITGGSSAISECATVRFSRKPFMSQESTSTTPPLTQAWLKNVQRPFLNKPIVAVDWSPVRRPSRSGVFPVIGRSMPVAVTELRGSKQFTLTIMFTSLAEANEMDTILSNGSVVFLHVPADCPFPGGYYSIGDTEMRRGGSVRSERRFIDLPLTEVAAPASSVVGTTYTWQGVINDYATWADVIANNATWADLLERVGDPDDVVVP
ncbi:MAG: hypothetical protein HOQ21_09815 [Dermatophilaceae bacterium]|nr:hypothetical protein [Dermatophilaceae bacterium]